MAYERYKNKHPLLKAEKIELMREYLEYYSERIAHHGLSELNIKIPRSAFDKILQEIGSILVQYANKAAKEDGEIKDFLTNNPLPSHIHELLPDEYRAFSLLLNALKQWVSSESAAIDRFLLGGRARQICREAVDHCIVTGGDLGEQPELHHPMRDGRPPVYISKKGHEIIEYRHANKVVTP